MKHKVTEYKLDNGAQGLAINLPGSEVVNLVVRFNSGFQFADPNKYEIPHVMEHILATVSKKYSEPNGFYIEASKNGAYVNANTSTIANGYVYECADFELDRILDLLEEQLVRPLFVDWSLKAELGNVRQELSRIQSEYGRLANILLMERAYPGEEKNLDERLDQLKNITLADMKRHYRHTHTATNARFFVVGNFKDNGAGVVARLERILDQLDHGQRFSPITQIGKGQERPLVASRDIAQLYYTIDFYGPDLDERDQLGQVLFRSVLVGSFASRILGELRRRGLAYDIGMSRMTQPGRSDIGFDGYVTMKNAQPLVNVITQHLRACLNGEITAEEVRASQTLAVGGSKRSFQTSADIIGWYIGAYENRGIILDFDTRMEQLMAVTCDDVIRVANRMLLKQRYASAFVGPIDEKVAAKLHESIKTIWQ